MKKKVVCLMVILSSLSGCKDKDDYRAAVLADVQREQNDPKSKDYKVDVEVLTDCILQTSTQNMPGLFGLDPERITAYRNYAQMITIMQTPTKEGIDKLRGVFGSPKALADARGNYTQSMVDCLSNLVTSGEQKQ